MDVMAIRLTTIFSLIAVMGAHAQAPNPDEQVRRAVQAFYAAFNGHDFGHASDYTTDDWNHINPYGGWTRGRAAVLAELEQAHSTLLKGVEVTIDTMTVRFATPDVAIATVTERIGTYFPPDGVDRGTNRHENERHVKTFVVVKHDGRWLIMQDQNTIIGP